MNLDNEYGKGVNEEMVNEVFEGAKLSTKVCKRFIENARRMLVIFFTLFCTELNAWE